MKLVGLAGKIAIFAAKIAMRQAMLSTAYWPPIQYFSKFLLYDLLIVEQHDHYTKQTYRNRCRILGPNGVETLSIPVHKGESHKTKVKDIRIDFDKPWPQQHWRALRAAYRSSPFYEFFAPELETLYTQPAPFLLEWNNQLLKWALDTLGIDTHFRLSRDFVAEPPPRTHDFRERIHPKARMQQPDTHFTPLPYTQVFDDKFPFAPNLSILDLLFMEGPNALQVLRKSVRSPHE